MNSVSFDPKIKQNTLNGMEMGVTMRYMSEKYFKMMCGVQMEINYSQRGWSEKIEDGSGNTYSRTMNYVEIPLLAHLAFGKDALNRGVKFFINAGPQIGLLIGESESMENIDMNALTDTQKAVYGDKIQNKFDYGIAGGGGIEFRTKKAGSFLLEGRYYFALSDFYSTTKKDYFSRAAHGTITVKLTYLFDLKK